jgi:hypothetical protein
MEALPGSEVSKAEALCLLWYSMLIKGLPCLPEIALAE